MWSRTAWVAVVFAYVAVLIVGIVCECVRVRRRRLAEQNARRERERSDDVIGFR